MTADDAERQYQELLGEDLWALAKREPKALQKAHPLTTLPSKKLLRGSFRLEFADGKIRKGQCLRSKADAERVELLCRLMDSRFFPPVLARRGSALLAEWVDGHPLSSDQVDSALLEHCGEIMGAMHVTPLPEELRARYACDVAGWRSRMRHNIEDLANRQALDPATTRLALKVAEAWVPDDTTVGLIHGDFCIENFVETETGEITIVDNETLSIDVCAYDLARTHSRWPMNREQAKAFHDGYHRYRTSADFQKCYLYWMVAVLTEAAVFRLQAASGGAEALLERLKRLLEGGATNAWAGA